MRTKAILVLVALAASIPVAASKVDTRSVSMRVASASGTEESNGAVDVAATRRRNDFAAMQTFRPGYPFWQHVFTLPDRLIAFGSAVDGRLLATFPAKGDWVRDAAWARPGARPHPRGSTARSHTAFGDGDGAGVRDGPGLYQQPARPLVRVRSSVRRLIDRGMLELNVLRDVEASLSLQ